MLHIPTCIVDWTYSPEGRDRLKLTKLELQILDAFWRLGPSSVREILETFPAKGRPAYTTVQTVIYRLERKKALRCVKRISNANIFAASITPKAARRAIVDDVLALFGGRVQALMSHLVETGDLTFDDIKEAEQALRKARKEER
jgi:BlaI family transcriptional regulator, penicillinase repressor